MATRVFRGRGNLVGRHDVPEAPPKRAMPVIQSFAKGTLKKEDCQQFEKKINELIERYNEANEDDKRALLAQIQSKIQQIEYKYRPSDLAASKAFINVRNELFLEIKYQLASLAIPSLLNPTDNPSTLAELIANMAPDKADKLTGILIKGENDALVGELAALYETDDESHDAKAYRQFLQNNQITYLGGGNSKNFRVENNDTHMVEVLKVDCRLDMPRHVEQHLREKLGDKFTPNPAERSVVCKDPKTKKTVSRSLLVTEFCPSGSVLDYRVKMGKDIKTDDLHEKANDIFGQMSDIFLQIQDNGCFFPDAKFTNWLLDGSGKLRLADTKSFLFTDSNGNYSSGLEKNQRCGFVTTQCFNPPEYGSSKVNVDSAHAYILGKNLYAFMTVQVPEAKDAKGLDFSSNHFKGEKGGQYKHLIESLVKSDPKKRMTLNDARLELFLIKEPEFRAVFDDLKSLRFGPNDKAMNDHINQKIQQISTANPDDRAMIKRDLEADVEQLKTNAQLKEIKSITQNLRDSSHWYTIGKNKKAGLIDAAMGQVSIEERKTFGSNDSKEENQVVRELARHRHIGKRGKVYVNKDNEIDNGKAAKTYKEFKSKFNEHKDALSEKDMSSSLRHR
jgi:hypothetical protein